MIFQKSLKKRAEKLFPLIILVLASAVAYLPQAGRLGYYRDDWNLIYAGMTQGATKFIDIYSVDRPFIGYLFSWVFYPLFGNAALPWIISAYLIRLAGALTAYWLLSLLFPRQKLAGLFSASLFIIFPGFLQQPNAIQYQPHLLNLTLALLSIALSVRAFVSDIRPLHRLILIISAFLLGLVSLFMMEYYIGLEGVRLILLWYISRDSTSLIQRIRATLKRWIPYAFATSVFLVWRILIFHPQRTGTDVGKIFSGIVASPAYKILTVLSELLKDFIEISFMSWAVPPYQLVSAARLRDFGTALLLGGLTVGLIALLVWWFIRNHDVDSCLVSSETMDILWLGVAWVLITSIPIIMAGREVTFGASLDRFSFPGSLGAVMILVSFLFTLNSRHFRWGVFGAIGILAMMTQVINTTNYANQAETVRKFWWQLSWRVPQLERQTVLVAYIASVPIEEDYEIWGPANMIYYPEPGPLGVQSEVLTRVAVQDIQMGSASKRIMRTIEVERDYVNTLVLTMPTTSSCLHVIDGQRIELSESEDYRIQLVAPFSNLTRIRTEDKPHIPPETVFGPEPEHDWCYYYEQASLERQRENWAAVAALANRVRELGLRPRDRVEWLPFLYGLVYTRQYDAANSLIPVIQESSFIRFQVCQTLQKSPSSNNLAIVEGNAYLLQSLCGQRE